MSSDPLSKEEQDVLGEATAVSTEVLERQILQSAQGNGGGQPEAAPDDPAQMQQQLRAVRRELRAVRSTMARLQPVDNADGEGEQEEAAAPAPLARGELQQAVMRERLAGLEAEQRSLEQALTQAGCAPEAELATAQAQAAPATLPIAGGKGGAGGRQRRQVHFVDLEEADLFDAVDAAAERGQGASLVETERDRLIRLGVLTPFDRLGGFERRVERGSEGHGAAGPRAMPTGAAADALIERTAERMRAVRAARPTSKLLEASELPPPQRATRRVDEGFWRASASGRTAPPKKRRASTLPRAPRRRRLRRAAEARGSGDESSDAEDGSGSSGSEAEAQLDVRGEFDDAYDGAYQQRQEAYLAKERRRKKRRQEARAAAIDTDEEDADEEEGDTRAAQDGDGGDDYEDDDVVFEGGFRVPGPLYWRLFDYQRTGVKWLWELHTQRAGGIVGDEMGLGKTAQVAAFLAGLHHSGMYRPTLVVCPATVLRQWLRELRTWYPPFRVAILHDSAAGGGRGDVLRSVAASGAGVLLTTYEQLRRRREALLAVRWGYAVLDEGHKIRNPDAEVTLAAKQLPTVHRLIMTGSPIQNRLTELWSLFDFVFPGKLGTLPVFQAQFALPIQIGGYANASPLQVSAAYRCAVVLRDLISPYLLRRRKADVAASLPRKTERVLFCSLSAEQRDMYRAYLASKEASEIVQGERGALAGIDVLRKICNHPDLLERAKWEAAASYGAVSRSGKMQVLDRVLGHWHQQGHKALVFTQTQQMLDIIERAVQSHGWRYHRMDGSTPVPSRARLIDDFNANPDVFAFLLTTRVGGLGVNLTGANRCVLFDPDWNPQTDAQARERAWRVGQQRDVTVYRLITGGTIEEKVYHRQVYKQFLTDRVLRDPRQRRFFKAKDLADLFTLGEEYGDGNETAAIFASLGTEITAADVAGEEEEGGDGGGALGDGIREGSPSDRDDYDSGGEAPQRRRRQADAEDGLPGGSGVLREEDAAPADPGGGGDANGGGDARILRDLFEGTGVKAALDHDKIEGAHDPGHRAAQQEAVKIARRAAEALRQSRLQVQAAPVSQPTWTGRSGAAGMPGQPPRFGRVVNPRLRLAPAPAAGAAAPPPRFGSTGAAGAAAGVAPTSAQLLEQLRQRREAAASAAAAPELVQARTLGERIAAFLQGRGGAAPTEEVVSNFRREVGAADVALFRGVLKQVAALQRRGGSGPKVWVLRPEFAAAEGA